MVKLATQHGFTDYEIAWSRRLIQLDPGGTATPFSQRVIRLRQDGRLAGNIASWMLTRTSFRNAMAFERYQLRPKEFEVLSLVRDLLDEWLAESDLDG